MWRGILLAGLAVVPGESAPAAEFGPRAPAALLEPGPVGSSAAVSAGRPSGQGPGVEGPSADDMVLIPAGAAIMGLDRGKEDFSPEHRVDLAAFYIDRHEVSNAAYERFDPHHRRDRASDCDDCPVTNVSWSEAAAHCRRAGKRLPTEAEWEKAARGPEGYLYGHGNEYRQEKARTEAPGATRAGSYPPNDYGLMDMLGNAWEWCGDFYERGYYRRSPERNPQGPVKGPGRVIRGGSFKNGPEVHLATRSWSKPAYRYRSIGCRCAGDGPKGAP